MVPEPAREPATWICLRYRWSEYKIRIRVKMNPDLNSVYFEIGNIAFTADPSTVNIVFWRGDRLPKM